MEYFAAHPTTFRNVNYRSRLEAKWASFFTDLGWEFQYEPFDLKGWVPDFEIKTKTDKRLLVEVKPVSFRDCQFEHEETFAKATKYDGDYNILLCGTNVFPIQNDYIAIGFLTGPDYKSIQWEKEYEGPDVAAVKFLNSYFDISGYYGHWENVLELYDDRMINGYSKKKFLSDYNFSNNVIYGFWADAHNNTKFDAFKYYNDRKCAGS